MYSSLGAAAAPSGAPDSACPLLDVPAPLEVPTPADAARSRDLDRCFFDPNALSIFGNSRRRGGADVGGVGGRMLGSGWDRVERCEPCLGDGGGIAG